jgi:GAF domain
MKDDQDSPLRLERAAQVLASAEAEIILDLCVERARALAQTPIALATVITRHVQFFKSQTGLPDELAQSCSSSRRTSFCQFIVETGQPLEIVDAIDSELVPQEMVEQYGIRSYYGIPLRVLGEVIGALNVVDVVPRELDGSVKAELLTLCERASNELDRIVSNTILAVNQNQAAGARGLLREQTARLCDAMRDLLPVCVRMRAASERGEPFAAVAGPEARSACSSVEDAKSLADEMSKLTSGLGTELGSIEREEIGRALAEIVANLMTLTPLMQVVSKVMKGGIDLEVGARAVIAGRQAFDIPGAVLAQLEDVRTLLDGDAHVYDV